MSIRRRLCMPRGALACVLAIVSTLALAQATSPTTPGRPLRAASAAAEKSPLTLAQAQTRAAATGQAVVADALTTETTQTTVNPDGTVTLTENVQPVRVWQNGAWVSLDA